MGPNLLMITAVLATWGLVTSFRSSVTVCVQKARQDEDGIGLTYLLNVRFDHMLFSKRIGRKPPEADRCELLSKLYLKG